MTDVKKMVQEKYSNIVLDDTNCCGTDSYTILSENYEKLDGYKKEADYNLGCGVPTQFADIKTNNSVLDLGSGAGNDCFVARAIVGEKGKVTGIDFTQAMIDKANKNLQNLQYSNVEFIIGDIDNIPIPNNTFDVVISNCVLNLVPDKNRAFSEIMRVLKHGGHFCVSDVVISGKLPEELKKDADLYAGCVAGAIDRNEYLSIIEKQGFKNIKIHKEKIIDLPDKLLLKHLSTKKLKAYRESGVGIYSITVNADKD